MRLLDEVYKAVLVHVTAFIAEEIREITPEVQAIMLSSIDKITADVLEFTKEKIENLISIYNDEGSE